MATTVESDITSTSWSPKLQDLPVFGLPGQEFYLIHITALVSLTISIVTSIGILIYLSMCASKTKHFKRPIGERLPVYLALTDLIFSISHELDHWYMLVTKYHPPDHICIIFAFFLEVFLTAQSLVVLFTAVGAMVLVVFEKQIGLGRFDWKLLVFALGVPIALGIAGTLIPFLGQSGPWCFIDMRRPYGVIISNLLGMFQVGVFLTSAICYSVVWVKIQKTRHRLSNINPEQTKRNQNTAWTMMLFVLAYLFQYSSLIIQSLWSLVEVPPVELFIVTVALVNLGGVYNALAYTLIRKLLSKSLKAEQQGTKRNVTSLSSTETLDTHI